MLDFTTVDWPAEFHNTDTPEFVGPLTEQEQAEVDFFTAQNEAYGYDTPEFKAFEEAQHAEHIGAAVALMNCYLCYLEEHGHADNSPNTDLGPLRGVVKEGTSRTHPTHPEADVYTTYTLTCGHTLI